MKLARSEILAKWIARRDEYKRLSASVDAATLCEDVVADLEALVQDDDERAVTLVEAAERSGYSADHLGRLIRLGKLRNVGRKNRPLLRVSELPVRPGPVDRTRGTGYDPNTDARSLRVRR